MSETTYLYKYRSMANLKWAERIFTQNELYFPTAAHFNDPFDCKFGWSLEGTESQIKTYFRENLKQQESRLTRVQRRIWLKGNASRKNTTNPAFINGVQEALAGIVNGVGIYSLTRIFDDILMWSHYADCHKGFCLKFLEDMTQYFMAAAQEVHYTEEFPIINRITDRDDVVLKKALLTKASHWSYEKEWRIVDPEKGAGVRFFPPYILEGVIFGCRMSEDHKATIRRWCAGRRHPIKFYQAKEASGTYSLDIAEV